MASMRLRLLPLLIACAVFTPTGLSLAANNTSGSKNVAHDQGKTHVVGFVTGDNFEQADALTRALKKVLEESSNQKLGAGDFSLEVLTAALGCPEKPDVPCLKKIASKISSTQYLWGTIALDGQRAEVELHLYSEASGDKKVKFSYQASLKDSMEGDLLDIAANGIAQLLGPLRFRVIVRSNQYRGMVVVDGKEAGPLVNGEATLELPSGDHEFSLKPLPKSAGEPGASDSGEPGEVIATQSERVSVTGQTMVRLDPKGSHAGGAGEKSISDGTGMARGASQLPTDAFADSPQKPGNAQRTWGYVSLAAGGALLAGGVASATSLYLLNHKENFQRYREGLLPKQNACSEAARDHEVEGAMSAADVRSLCGTASTLEIAEIVLFAGGAVAVGTGLTLLLTSKSTQPAAVQSIKPRVSFGRGRGDVGVVVQF